MDAPLMTMVSVYSLMVKNMNNEHRCRLCGRVIVQRHHNARYYRECATNMVGMSAYHYTIPLPDIWYSEKYYAKVKEIVP